ncbi:hypothetical protein LEMLEM_LOCUS12106, partial [Lemmus lemmus]
HRALPNSGSSRLRHKVSSDHPVGALGHKVSTDHPVGALAVYFFCWVPMVRS